MRRRGWRFAAIGSMLAALAWAAWFVSRNVERRVAIVEPGRIVRGAWQNAAPLLRLIERERIRTIVTLTAINSDDPKYVDQSGTVRRSGVDWVIVPMRGSRATLDQMAEAADLVAEPARQPVFFHCVGGHHRSSLVQAAYRIRHQGWSAERAWREVAALPWAVPDAPADRSDRRLIEQFAASSFAFHRKDRPDEATTDPLAASPGRLDAGGRRGVRPLALGGR